ncbi:hypothetical protein F4805DRAFT_416297 [Annulohypoxylon moriforme]|nr:hypothetical protein F4805DRAFT_416297 [Annulohypoxylon moriforme]
MASKMDLDQGGVAAHLTERVQQWRIGVSKQNNNGGIIAHLYNSGRNLYQAFMRNISSEKLGSKSSYRRLENGYTNYLIWADDFKAQAGGLDILLHNSQKLRKFTIRILIKICVILEKLFSAHMPIVLFGLTKETSWIVRDNDNEELATPESLEDLTEELLDEIENLLDLSPRLEEPVPDTSIEEHAASKRSDPWNPIYFFSNRILAKYPKCDFNLAVALGRANWDAFQRITARREIKSIERGDKAADNITNLFYGCGLGTSKPSTDSNAFIIVSCYGDGEEKSTIPLLPHNIDESHPFSCIACGKQLENRDAGTWRQHLLADLRPWVCCQTFCPCEHTPFTTQEQWQDHMRRRIYERHPEWDHKTCPICSEVLHPSINITISHVRHHLEEISLAILPCSLNDDGGGKGATIPAENSIPDLGNIEFIDQPKQRNATLSPSTTGAADANPVHRGREGGGGGGGCKIYFTHDKKALWYCCQCTSGPMTVDITPTCIFCLNHQRC